MKNYTIDRQGGFWNARIYLRDENAWIRKNFSSFAEAEAWGQKMSR
jgi:hypothetical protein